MAFPSEYKPQETSFFTMQYLKSNPTVRVRVMTDFDTGYRVWNGSKFYYARQVRDIPASEIGFGQDGSPAKISEVIKSVCWNYDTQQFEVFEVDKASIIRAIYDFDADPDYGDTKGYDLKISKTGSGMQTRYAVVPTPPKAVIAEIAESFKECELSNKIKLSSSQDDAVSKAVAEIDIEDDIEF